MSNGSPEVLLKIVNSQLMDRLSKMLGHNTRPSCNGVLEVRLSDLLEREEQMSI